MKKASFLNSVELDVLDVVPRKSIASPILTLWPDKRFKGFSIFDGFRIQAHYKSAVTILFGSFYWKD